MRLNQTSPSLASYSRMFKNAMDVDRAKRQYITNEESFCIVTESILSFQAPLLVFDKNLILSIDFFRLFIYTGAPGNRYSSHKYIIQSTNSMFVQVSPYKGGQPVFYRIHNVIKAYNIVIIFGACAI